MVGHVAGPGSVVTTCPSTRPVVVSTATVMVISSFEAGMVVMARLVAPRFFELSIHAVSMPIL